MSFSSGLQSAVSGGIKGLGNLRVSLTLTIQGDQTYNTTTGAVTGGASTATVYGCWATIRTDEFAGLSAQSVDRAKIQFGDRKFLLEGLAGHVPTAGDKLSDGTLTWQVLMVTSDPASALFVCYVREV
jgi:hypothetical protein